MYTFLRRAVTSVLVAGGLALTSTGVVRVEDHVTPAVLMAVLAGGAVLLYRRPRRGRATFEELLVVHEPAFAGGVVPTQRTPPPPHCAIPAPRTSPEEVMPIGGHVVGALGPWHTARASGLTRHGVRHCVVPRGRLPHQRRAPGGS